MAVPVENITIEQGADFEKVYTLKNPDSSIIDLSNYTAIAKIKRHSTSTTSYDFNVGIASTVGQITISIAGTITDTIPYGRHYYDIFTTDTLTGIVTKAYTGMALVNSSISL